MKILSTVLIVLFTIGTNLAQEYHYRFYTNEVMSVSQTSLHEIGDFAEIHERFESEWVDEYRSNTVRIISDVADESIAGSGASFTDAQKKLMKSAAVGDDLVLEVRYIPKNDLKDNPEQTLKYKFKIAPAVDTQFDDPLTSLDDYINTNIIEQLQIMNKTIGSSPKLSFVVDDEGIVTNADLSVSTEDDIVDAVIHQAICDMPNWAPAQNINGETVAQEVQFFIADRAKTCSINLIRE